MERAKLLKKEDNSDIKKISEIRGRNRPLTLLLKNKTGYQHLEDYPQEVDYYLAQNEERESKLRTEREKIGKEITSAKGKELTKKLQRKNDLEVRIKELEKEQQKSIFPKYLSYITNNERL